MSDSDAESDSLQGSDEDGFLEDDDNNVVMIVDQMTASNTQIFPAVQLMLVCYCQVMGYSDSEDGSDYDSESDDEEMAYDQRRGKSSGKHYILFHCPII